MVERHKHGFVEIAAAIRERMTAQGAGHILPALNQSQHVTCQVFFIGGEEMRCSPAFLPLGVHGHLRDYTRYNSSMNSETAARLVELNREFYTRFGDSFSATRGRIQPGVRRVLGLLNGGENILDLGCGNGEFARELAKSSHRGTYLGLDFSLPLLRKAESHPEGFSADFQEVDLTRLATHADRVAFSGGWSWITAFAVLHHIPSRDLRVSLVQAVRDLLQPGGVFVHSNWQFLNSEKLTARIQPWEVASIPTSEVDAGDHLLDWRSGGKGLRYVHHFSGEEFADLASVGGFERIDRFESDGEGGRLSLYQIWRRP